MVPAYVWYFICIFSIELGNLADYCLQLGKLDEAEKLIDDSVRKKKDSFPANHPEFIHGKL